MREVRRSALVALGPERAFALIADVRRYPQFVPGCRTARIESQSEHEIVATLGISRGPLRTEFTTRNSLEPFRYIGLELVDGPFRTLKGGWTISPVGTDGCRIELELRFEFRLALPSALLDPVFEGLAAALVDAFVAESARDRGTS